MPQNAITERIDHIDNRVDQRKILPKRAERADRIEDPTKIGKWGQYKGRNT